MDVKRSSIHIMIGGNPYESTSPSPAEKPKIQDEITQGSQNIQTEPAKEHTPQLQEQRHSHHFSEVFVEHGAGSEVSSTEARRKNFQDDKSSPKNDKKRKCEFWLWVYLIVVLVIVICIIVMAVLQCNFRKNLRKEYHSITEDIQSVQYKSENDSAHNLKLLNETAIKISNKKLILADSRLRNNEEILDRISILVKVERDWIKSHGNLYYKLNMENATYHAAEAKCKATRGRLASKVLRKVVTKTEVDLFGELTNITKIWVGYHRKSVNSSWTWADGGQTKKATVKWMGDGGTRNQSGYDCAVVATQQFEVRKPAIMQPEECNNALPYVCEIEPMSLLRWHHG